MAVTIARYIGFCAGVKKAADEIFKLQKNKEKPIAVYGELIHNTQFNDKLAENEVYVAHNIEDCKDKIVVIRTHGISSKEEQKLMDVSQELVDLTCPKVKKVQSIVESYSNDGYRIIIAGNSTHPEVIGLKGYAHCCDVISEEVQALEIELAEKSVFISQTTFSEEKFHQLSEILKKRSSHIIIENTLCYATKYRQEEVKKLAAINDLVVVVGGKHSSNSKKLAETAGKYAKGDVMHIEICDELKLIALKKYKNIAIASGASTPDWIIKEVTEYIQKNH